MVKIWKYQEVENCLDEYRRYQEAFSEAALAKLEKLPLDENDLKYSRAMLTGKLPPVPIWSNWRVRELKAGCFAEAMLDHWGSLTQHAPTSLLHITIMDQRHVTGDRMTKLDIKDLTSKVRDAFGYYGLSHVSIIEIQPFDNVNAPGEGQGRWLQEHVHAVAKVDIGGKAAAMTVKELQATLEGRFEAPMLFTEIGPADAVRIQPIGASLADLTKTTAYPFKNPMIKATGFTSAKRAFSFVVAEPAGVQMVRLAEIHNLIPIKAMTFAGGDGCKIRTEASRRFREQINAVRLGRWDRWQEQQYVLAYWSRVKAAGRMERFLPPTIRV